MKVSNKLFLNSSILPTYPVAGLVQYHSGHISQLYSFGEKVMVRDFIKNKKSWSLGKINEVLVPGLTYVRKVDGLQ